jgi:uncharacterized membrane protein YraQ (UPF0718 family)
VVIFLALVASLITYKTGGSLATLAKAEATRTLEPRAEALSTSHQPALLRPLLRTLNYLAVVWPALVFGVLIGAAVRALVPASWLANTLGRASARAPLLGGLMGAPLMLCSCCVAPVFAAVHARTRQAGAASALLLGSPSLNPAALVLTFLLFSPGIGLARAAGALLLVFGVSYLATRFGAEREASDVACALEPPAKGLSDTLRAFAQEAGRIAATTLPLILLGVFASSLLVEFVSVENLAAGSARLATVLLVAAVGVPLALPTFAEIPLALGLLAAGAPTGAAVALLIAGPAINLPSLFTLRRLVGARYALSVGVGTFVVAVAVGLAI